MRKAYKQILGILVIGIIQVSTIAGQNLVPDKPQGPAYDYFCTWAAQNYLYGWGKDSLDLKTVVTESGKYATTLMHEKWLTGPEGWLSFFPHVRSDLIFLIDDGYYVNGMDAMEIDEAKFPSFKGTPEVRLKKLNDFVTNAGWRRLGLWSRGIKSLSEAEERVKWAKAAGIEYWKVDGGDATFQYVPLRNKIYPNLVLEHAKWPRISVFNNGPKGSLMPNYAPNYLSHLENTDVVRIYDIDQPIGQVSGIARVAGLLEIANGNQKAKAIINCEDLATLGAALGCSFGIFRFPIMGKRPQGDPDIFNAGPRQQKKRMDEVTRSVLWHRIAPPFPANAQPVLVDSVLLTDSMTIKKGDTWDWELQSPLIQSAPARITRGLPLPTVVAKGDAPFVVAARYPNEAVSIGTFGRFSDKNGYKFPMADITQKLGNVPPAIGIFGQYKSLTFTFDKSIKGKKVLAQDLAASKAIDVTRQVIIKGNTLILPGSLIAKVGLEASTPGDLSDPGLVLVIK